MHEDLKKAIVLLALGLVLLIFGYFSRYLKSSHNEEPKTKEDKIKRGLLNVTYVNYLSKGILGLIIIIISLVFFIKYLLFLL